MGQNNSYFQLDVRSDGVYIWIFPAGENGKALTIGELTGYLNSRGLNNYDIRELNRAIYLDTKSEIRVGDNFGIEIDETMAMRISEDGMMVHCRFYPASAGGNKLTEQKIREEITAHGIRVKLREDVLAQILKGKEYCTDYLLVIGKPAVNGKDARIKYFFTTNLNLRPKRNEDGTVNYRELRTISHVRKGDLLAKLDKEVAGREGINVYGQVVKPRPVKAKRLAYGRNITISEDGTEIYSGVDGHVSLVGGRVFVADIYEVPADVDNSTGNIDYAGNVHVAGNVKTGFIVRAHGDIVVEGVVEDALLEADGQIIVKRGIHGMTRGTLKAKGNIMCKFIENASVIAGGYVETESILHSKVSAGTQIHVNGKKGFITGGIIRAGAVIEARTIGSPMGGVTRVEVGIEPEKKERFTVLQKQMQQYNQEIAQIKPILVTYSEKAAKGEKFTAEQLNYIRQMAKKLQEKQSQAGMIQEEYLGLHEEMMQSNNAKIIIHRTIYAGVTVSISDVTLTLREDRSYCQITRDQGEIVIGNL